MGAIEVGSKVWEWSMESLEVALQRALHLRTVRSARSALFILVWNYLLKPGGPVFPERQSRDSFQPLIYQYHENTILGR